MSAENETVSESDRAVVFGDAKKNWKWLLILGIIFERVDMFVDIAITTNLKIRNSFTTKKYMTATSET